jgi:hypothetical protein
MNRPLLCALLSVLLVSASRATVVFDQPHNGGGTLHKSSWYPPDGLDGDIYCWDNFTVASNSAISGIHWRGGYEFHPSGSGQSPVFDFEVSIYRSIAAGGQPDLGAGGRLVQYFVGANAGETSAGAFGGVAMYDYAFTLPSPFQAAGGTNYWVQIEASQGLASPSFAPDWGLAVGTGGNNSHFRKITGGTYQVIAGDLAFSLLTSGAPTVTISASESPTGAGTISGAGSYPIGSTASLQATSNTGWGFRNWTESGTQVSTNAHYTFTATVNRTLVANFGPAYTILTSSYPSYGGVVTGAGVYTSGSNVTLVATPNHGFVFNSWSDGGTTPTYSFPAASDLQLTAFFDSAPHAVTFDFDNAPVHTPLPIDLTLNGLTAHVTGGYSIQPVGTVGISPAGFSGLCVYPNSVFQADLGIGFSQVLTDFSILYAVDELGCDTSARMRVNALMNGVVVGTNTMVAPVPGTYPSATLSIVAPTGFNSVVVHWDAPGSGCQDYGPIFLADNVTVTRAVTAGLGDGISSGTPRLFSPAPNPFQQATTIRFDLPRAGDVRLKVYDIAGRHVCTLVSESMPVGNRSLTWNGVDDAGHRVSAGVYVLRLETAGARENRRILLLK